TTDVFPNSRPHWPPRSTGRPCRSAQVASLSRMFESLAFRRARGPRKPEALSEDRKHYYYMPPAHSLPDQNPNAVLSQSQEKTTMRLPLGLVRLPPRAHSGHE